MQAISLTVCTEKFSSILVMEVSHCLSTPQHTTSMCALQVRLIQGPPGTGKTTTTTRLLSVLGSIGQRTLSCAPTNVAVAEVASRYLAIVTGSTSSSSKSTALITASGAGSSTNSTSTSRDQQQFADFCSSEHGYWPGSGSYQALLPGDLLLVGNADKIDKQGPLAQVYLPCRVERLERAAVGWEGLVKELLAALEDPLGFCSQRDW